MSWRKWIVRGLVFSIVGACVCAAYLYRYWTNPAAVRGHVITFLKAHFPGTVFTLDGAHMSLLGGIVLSDLRLARRDDPEQIDFMHVPSATIYHDKEKLLDSVLSIRKIELDHLRLRLVRQRDGCWNLADVLKLAEPNVPIPTCVVNDATLVLEDRLDGANLAGVEINHVNLTFINDPLAIVHINGGARSELLGELEIHGTRNRRTGDLNLSLQVQGLTVTPALLQRLAARCPRGSLDGLRLEGQADMKADIAYAPGQTPSFSYKVNGRLTHGTLHHPSVPIPLEDMDARICCHDGLVQVEDFKAKSGAAAVWARGRARLPCPDSDFEGELEIKHLKLDSALFNKLPVQFRKLGMQFEPKGPATLRVECARRAGDWVKPASGRDSTVALEPENITAKFDKFPYLLERVGGVLKLNLISSRIDVDILAHAGVRPVFIKGSWQGKEDQTDAAIDVQADDLPLDAKLLEALRGGASAGNPTTFYELARSFHARGRGDIKVLIRHVPGAAAKDFANEYHVRFHDADINWDQFPYPLTKVSGILDIYPHYMRFHDCQGQHGGGIILVEGRTTPERIGDARPRLIIGITGKNIALDADLGRAMRSHEKLHKSWEMFAPSGRADFTASIDRLKGPGVPEAEVLEDMSVSLDVRGGTIQPLFFPYALSDLTTRFHYHQHKVNLARLSGQHGSTQISLGTSLIDLHPQGGFYAELKQLRARELRTDADFVRALPAALKSACAAIDLREPVMLQTDLVVAMAGGPNSEPDIYWDGQLWLKRARLKTGLELSDVTGTLACRGRHRRDPDRGQILELNGNFRLDQVTLLKQPFHDVQGNFHVLDKEPEVLALGLKAPLFGGDVSGQVRIEMNKSKTRYNLNLTASQIDLQEFGRHNLGGESKLKGLAGGRLVLSGLDTGVDSLEGNGQIEIPRGHIYPYNIPPLLDLLKLLALRAPDRTMFDEANAFFHINGQRVQVDKLELLGNAVSLYGRGDFDFKQDGTQVKLDFYPSWGRVEQLMPEALRSIPAEIGKQMLKIEMRGQVGGNLKLTKRPVPSLLHVWDKMIGSK